MKAKLALMVEEHWRPRVHRLRPSLYPGNSTYDALRDVLCRFGAGDFHAY